MAFYRVFAVVILMLQSIWGSFASAQEKLLLVTEEWPPFNYAQDGKPGGFSVEIVEEIMAVMDKRYEIKLLPSLRTTRIINYRSRTMMFSLFRTPQRESEYKWIGPLANGTIYFYKRRDDKLKIETLDDLKTLNRIATRNGGTIRTLLLEQGFDNLDSTATKSIQVYQKLLLGRADAAISDTDLGVIYNLRSLNVDTALLEKIPIPVFRDDLYIAASRDIPDEEIQLWQSALDRLKADGTYDRILEKYLSVPAPQPGLNGVN